MSKRLSARILLLGLMGLLLLVMGPGLGEAQTYCDDPYSNTGIGWVPPWGWSCVGWSPSSCTECYTMGGGSCVTTGSRCEPFQEMP